MYGLLKSYRAAKLVRGGVFFKLPWVAMMLEVALGAADAKVKHKDPNQVKLLDDDDSMGVLVESDQATLGLGIDLHDILVLDKTSHDTWVSTPPYLKSNFAKS